MIKIDRVNNFDLIRLLAALQVVVFHSYEHLELNSVFFRHLISYFLRFFPGVPIFFFINGFLIYASFNRNSGNLKGYFKNRILRIFPALWICCLVTISLLLLDYPKSITNLFLSGGFYLWILGQFTLFQFYTPDILRFWGVGTPNGSLWTIMVEFQFYLAVPIIFFLFRKINSWLVFSLLFVASLSVNYFVGISDDSQIIFKLLGVSVFLISINF